MFTGINAFLFDLDGTIADSLWIWKQIDIDFLKMFGLDFPNGIQEDLGGSSFYEVAVYFKKRFSLDWSLEQIMDKWNEMAQEKYENDIPLKAGVRDFMQKANEKGIKMAIASSNSRHLVEKFLEKQGIDIYISEIVTSDEIKNGKPAPDVYLEAASRLAVKPSECYVFEDIPDGIKAGKGAGMRVCAMEDKYSLHQTEEKKQQADYYAVSFEDLIEYV